MQFTFLTQVIPSKPTACATIRNQHGISQNGYYTLFDSSNKPYHAFCDFQSDPGYAWTLIESLSLTYAQSASFRKSFQYNVPSNECTPNWSKYRLSITKMKSIQNTASSTHFRATCNFNGDSEKGLQNRRDYVRVSFCAYPYFLIARSSWTCAVVDYINIHGTSCSKCSIPLYSYSSSYHLYIDLSQAKVNCGRFNVSSAINGEDVFGSYGTVNNQFSCGRSSSSTTNWWIGGTYCD